jgi:hypothetical protein
MRKIESRVQVADRCAPWKISNGAAYLVLQTLQFHRHFYQSQSHVTTDGQSVSP